MRRICIAALVEIALVACNGRIADGTNANEKGTPAVTPTTASEPDPRATPNDDATYDAPQMKPVSAAQCTITAKDSAAGDLPLPPGVDGVLQYVSVGLASGDLKLVVGTPCATANDKAACHAAITTLVPPFVPDPSGSSGSSGGCIAPAGPTDFLVLTSGDKVTKIAHGSEVVALYGPVTTAAEAALVAQLDTIFAPTCKEVTPDSDGGAFDFSYEELESSDGGIQYIGPPTGPCVGRLTEGAVAPHVAAGVGGWLGAMAALERSAVTAFERMALELRHHGAPDTLVARAVKARADEVRHARAMARQAARFGGRVPASDSGDRDVRDLEAVALENAVEGCVRETLGAVVAAHQARAAQDVELRAELAIIAREEAEHAQLSWDLAAWVEPLLSTEARARVAAARTDALARFGDALGTDADEQASVAGLSALAGLPSRTEAEAIVAATRAVLA